MKPSEVRPDNKSETAIVRVYVRLRTVQYIYYGTVVLDSFVCCSVAFVAQPSPFLAQREFGQGGV